ncbi:hypothetical protein K435DRAFT_781845 [Dendrothele bispora CBS 962.96]|uniref:Uncharacterized protein n=1 Tax=Dendrothele bispora (strain CBS 962.96) TaxID=1314807 RepID=A0A4S8LJ73_DENBC|nr:hypothetical protein K435DRAFT_781845 [Dendrothele bispora CBS 962.96]
MFFLLHILIAPFLFLSVFGSPIPIDVDAPQVISDVPSSPYVTRFSHRIQGIRDEASAKIWEYVNELPNLLSKEEKERRVDMFAERALEEPVFVSVRGISPPPREESYSVARRSIVVGVEEQRRSILDLANRNSVSSS